MPYYAYILYSESTDRYYYGQTNNLKSRLERHNSGLVRSTKASKPWRLFAWKETSTRKEAMKLEKMLKNIHSTERMKLFVTRYNFDLSE